MRDPMEEAIEPSSSRRVRDLLRHSAEAQAKALEEDGFADAFMQRLLNSRADRARAAPPCGGAWPEAWLVLPVGLLLALGLWTSTDLLLTAQVTIEELHRTGSLTDALPSQVPGVPLDSLPDMLLGAGGLVMAAWSSWLAWHALDWLLGDAEAARAVTGAPQSGAC